MRIQFTRSCTSSRSAKAAPNDMLGLLHTSTVVIRMNAILAACIECVELAIVKIIIQ